NRRWRDERGAVALTNGVVVAVVIVAGIVSVSLLARTARAANRINHKAENIARTGQGINIATDSDIQLHRTNETASSLLTTAPPPSSMSPSGSTTTSLRSTRISTAPSPWPRPSRTTPGTSSVRPRRPSGTPTASISAFPGPVAPAEPVNDRKGLNESWQPQPPQ